MTKRHRKQHVVILGGGFAGVKTALRLSEHEHFEVTLISDRLSFRYYPALYRAATGRSHIEAAVPLHDIFTHLPVKLVEDRVIKLQRDSKTVVTASRQHFKYDILIIALGMETNYFGIKGLEKFSFGIKSLEDAERLKTHLHQQLTATKQPDLNYIVIGGGPTGVELAGALPAYLRRICRLHGINRPKLQIELVEAMPRLLPHSPKSVSRAVKQRLQRLGIKVYLNQKVEAETADALIVNGRPIKSRTVVWTAGVANNPFFAANKFALNDHHQVVVNEFLAAEPDIYVLGDNAATKFSGLAQTALHDANFVSDNLVRAWHGRRLQTYHAHEPISVIPAGTGWAAVSWKRLALWGWSGWWLRRAADLLAYNDIEPFGRALHLWLADNEQEEDCPVCAARVSAEV